MSLQQSLHQYRDELTEAYDVAIQKIATSTSFKDVAVNEFIKFVTEEIQTILAFNNCGASIRNIYTKIKTPGANYKTIKYRDIDFILDEYKSYREGMREFLNSLKYSEDFNRLSSFLDGVIIRSKNFINDLYSDEYNPEKDIPDKEAIQYIDFMVSIAQNKEDYYSDVKTTMVALSVLPPEIKEKASVIYCECIVRFLYRIIMESFDILVKLESTFETSNSVLGERVKISSPLKLKMF